MAQPVSPHSVDRRQVFINCPFDEDYWPVMKAVVFAIFACGFTPRCAVDADDQSEGRLEKIIRLIRECRLGIHDLCRNGPDPGHGLARFNMPLELGLFMGATLFGKERKALLIMDAEPWAYHKFVSDLKGRDLRIHRHDPSLAVSHVRDWLNAQKITPALPGGKEINRRYRQFLHDLPALLRSARLDDSEVSKPEHFIDWNYLVTEWLAATLPQPVSRP